MKRWIAMFCALLALPAQALPIERCMNLSNGLDAPYEGAWRYVIEDNHIDAIADAGFDTIRLPVRFSAYYDDGIAPALLRRVDGIIQRALDQGLQVILDLHHFEELMDDPEGQADTFVAIWAELSQHYAGWPPALMFELINEPNDQLTTARADALYDRVLPIIRADHPDRWVILSGGRWGTIAEMRKLKPRDGAVAFTFHYYGPFDFTHQRATWVGRDMPYRAPVTQEEIAEVTRDITAIPDLGNPVFLGEFGVHNVIPDADRAPWIRAVVDAADTAGIGWCHWGFGANFRAYDPETDTWRPDILKALGLP
ncbi:glycoside hydrolase family 5 protein [Litoreibacter roseus]|uniref:Endoglucanase n=1 Tax=Litoreibacter roseus TaxID=2601869 RepID=A0A6N6JAW3_9RHOB|nr:glycoside hydrolase family 5 protein [Litoreibacter roseus]GFE63383.1 endoglucanase [Litoreibacter roseus]